MSSLKQRKLKQMIDYSNYWADQKQAYEEALRYIYSRQQGTIDSFRTPWPKVDDAGVDGLEWHTLTVLAGRPGTGKTLIKDQMIREATKHNPGRTINILEFQLEMLARASKVREFSSVLNRPYKEVCSAGGYVLSDQEFKKLHAYAKSAVGIDKSPVHVVEKSPVVETFRDIIHQYMNDNAQIVAGKTVYVHTVITLDHALLLKLSKHHKNKTDMLYELGEVITMLKRRYPIAFVVLSQLGRDAEKAERNENGRYGNYVLESDLFGGDALLQHADMVIGINRPAKREITQYGPQRFIIDSDDILVFHFLKVRNGDPRMSFFRAVFDKMRVDEMPTPAQYKRISTNV